MRQWCGLKKQSENDPVRIRHRLDAANKVVHHTAGRSRVDLDRVWDTAVVDIPELIAGLDRVLSALSHDG